MTLAPFADHRSRILPECIAQALFRIDYTQIGGLWVATFITLLLVPVLYAIFVLDLTILKWEKKEEKQQQPLVGQTEFAAD